MSDRLSNGAERANEPRSWYASAVDGAKDPACDGQAAARKDAMRPADTASKTSVNPAGVPERQVDCQPAERAPAGAGGLSDAQVRPRMRSAVGMAFPPEGPILKVRNRT